LYILGRYNYFFPLEKIEGLALRPFALMVGRQITRRGQEDIDMIMVVKRREKKNQNIVFAKT